MISETASHNRIKPSRSYYSLYKTLLFLLLFSLSGYASGQNALENADTSAFPYWMQMMQDPNANFYATQSAFNKYWENRDTKEKGTGYKVFKRWEYITQTHISPDGKRQSPGYVSKALKDYFENDPPDRSVSGTWTLSGPINYPTNATGQPTGMGRINAIAFHPTDPDIIFIGTPSGGIWKTTDGGDNWNSITSNLPTPGISSIFVHPGDPNIIYVGTGDRDSDDAPGLGVYKTTNGGASWTAANSSMPNATVGALLVHPTNPDTMVAATNTGLYRSTNGGTTWSLRLTGNVWKDLKYMPGNPAVVYAAYGGSFYRSTNSGLNWSNISIPQTGSRLVIGVSPDAPGTVYLVQSASNSTFKALMRSTDNGATFSTMSTTPNIFDYKCDGSGTSGQGFYDLCIHVDPNDADIVYCGSINVWKSTDGGINWTPKSHWVGIEYDPLLCSPAVHADQHCLERSPLTGTIYLGNDGGFYFTSDGGDTWTEKSGGLSISQVYKISQSNLDANLTLSGYQDNGTSLRNGSTFTTVGGGDGMECLFDYSNNTYRYRSGPGGALSRSTGSYYYTIGGKDKNGITESGDWVTPYMLHRTNPNTMFAGYKNVWRTTNVKTALNTDVTWSAISSGETSNCIAIEQPAGDLDILYIVRSGSLKRTDNANASAASVTWVSCTLPGGYTPTDLETHPTDPDILYATANYGVYKSFDKGITWSNISGTLPAVYTNCLVYDPNSIEGLYVGNQTGVWYKDAILADWVPFGTGLPVVDIRELEIYSAPDPADSRLMAATYGRGLWTSDLYIPFSCADALSTAIVAPSSTERMADLECSEGDWTHYFDQDGSNFYLLLSIKKGGQSIGSIGDGTFAVRQKGSAGVTIIPNNYPVNYCNTLNWHVMNRYWEVEPTIQPTAGVSVRFYYTVNDFDALVIALANATPPRTLTSHEQMLFYKVEDLLGNAYDINPVNGHTDIPIASGYGADGYYEYQHGQEATTTAWHHEVFNSVYHYGEYAVSKFSGGGGGGGNVGGAFPIELLYFTGNPAATANILTWATATERNNQFQIIERSLNGTDDWMEIGRVTGAGNSVTQTNYQLSDENPPVRAYYHLRAVDFDGAEQVSEVIYIERPSGEFSILNAFPVPVENDLHLWVNSPLSGEVTIRLHDVLGSVVYKNETTLSKGVSEITINMHDLPSGTYQVTLENKSSRVMKIVNRIKT